MAPPVPPPVNEEPTEEFAELDEFAKVSGTAASISAGSSAAITPGSAPWLKICPRVGLTNLQKR